MIDIRPTLTIIRASQRDQMYLDLVFVNYSLRKFFIIDRDIHSLVYFDKLYLAILIAYHLQTDVQIESVNKF